MTTDHAAALAEALEGFVLDLTVGLRNHEAMLTIDSNMLLRRIGRARAALAAYHASKDQADEN